MKKSATNKHKYLIGIDEVGRGPLAGPVAVGVVKLSWPSHESADSKSKVEWARGFRDSKKLSPKAREAWMVKVEEARSEGWLEYTVAFVAPGAIDKNGIAPSIRLALAKALEEIEQNYLGPSSAITEDGPRYQDVRVLLDGGLRAPAHYKNQETIIKGDEKELAIALASIVAKVARDKRMVALAKKYPAYGFEQHKGYGTRAHYEALEKHGLTPHHRKSFLKRLAG